MRLKRRDNHTGGIPVPGLESELVTADPSLLQPAVIQTIATTPFYAAVVGERFLSSGPNAPPVDADSAFGSHVSGHAHEYVDSGQTEQRRLHCDLRCQLSHRLQFRGCAFFSVDYCSAEPMSGQCSVGLNWYLLVVVMVFNAVNAICLGLYLGDYSRKDGCSR